MQYGEVPASDHGQPQAILILSTAGATLLSLHSRAGRIACATLMVVLTIAVIAAMAIGIRATQTPSWLQTAASIALLAGVVLHGAALARLKALPHPWLQN